MMRSECADSGSRLMMKAAAPSEIGQQSIRLSGSATGGEASTSSTVSAARSCAPGWLPACRRIRTASSARSRSVVPNSCM
ncbi:hypothetical protein D5045_07390 [Verminephrobacter eiseniae]|nr:hypothetical protein [Verminephrobacter eiseniae]